jgi:hypothetical protein
MVPAGKACPRAMQYFFNISYIKLQPPGVKLRALTL